MLQILVNGRSWQKMSDDQDGCEWVNMFTVPAYPGCPGQRAICKSASRSRHQHPTTQLFTGRMPFLLPNQQRQSTESNWSSYWKHRMKWSSGESECALTRRGCCWVWDISVAVATGSHRACECRYLTAPACQTGPTQCQQTSDSRQQHPTSTHTQYCVQNVSISVCLLPILHCESKNRTPNSCS